MATKTLKADGSGDYKRIQDWLSWVATQSPLTEVQELVMYDNDPNTVVIDGTIVTSVANYIKIRAADTKRHTGITGTGVMVSNDTNVIFINANHVRIDGIEFYGQSTNSSTAVVVFGSSNYSADSDIRIENCLLHDTVAGSNYIFLASKPGLNLTLNNNIGYTNHRIIDSRNSASLKSNNNIFWRNADVLGMVCGAEMTCYNTYCGKVSGTSQDFWQGGSAPRGSNNASSDGTATVAGRFTNSLANIAGTSAFVSVTAGAEDFHTKDNTSPLIDKGVVVAGLNYDILGLARTFGTAPDISAFEFGAGPPPDTTAPVLTGALISNSETAIGFTLAWPTATDDVAVVGYEYSLDNGVTYTSVGKVTTYAVSGVNSGTTYHTAVRAFDAANNRSAPLFHDVTTLAAQTDFSPPVLNGALTTSNVSPNSATFTWPAATDDKGVVGYELSIDNGVTYTGVGLVTTIAENNLLSSTLYHCKLRAFDAAGNKSVPLSVDLTTPAPPDTAAPTFGGSITKSNITDSGFTLSWPAATDNVGVTGYEISLNSGSSYQDAGNVLTKTYTGKASSTAYPVAIRAYDAAGNRSASLTTTVTTLAAAATGYTLVAGANTIHIGSGGKNFVDFKDFAAWLNQQDLIAVNATILAIVWNDLATTGYIQMLPKTFDDSHYVQIQPAPGKGVNELDPTGALGYGTQGIELTLGIGSNSLQIGKGVGLYGFRVNTPAAAGLGTGGGDLKGALVLSTYQQLNGGSTLSEVRGCRFKSALDTGGVVVQSGNGTMSPHIADCAFFHTSGGGTSLQNQYSSTMERLTFVRQGTATGAGTAVRNDGYGGAIIRDCVAVGSNATAYDLAVAPVTFSNNFADTDVTGNPVGLTVVKGVNVLIQGPDDIRPTANGPLIKAGSQAAASTNDIRGQNRGPYPDAGASQLNPSIATPVAVITSVDVNGQTVSIVGTVSGSPGQGVATLPPAASSPGGAQIQGPTTNITISNGGFNLQWVNVPPGNYAAPVVTFSNIGGPSAPATGGTAVTILDVEGMPQAPTPNAVGVIHAAGTLVLPQR